MLQSSVPVQALRYSLILEKVATPYTPSAISSPVVPQYIAVTF